jgi:transcriptional regulator with XRE-family HTH domain
MLYNITDVTNVNYFCNYILNYICNVIISDMKDRLLEFLKAENKSSAQLADEIGVQPSGISHILSGRNNPSLDFVLKMLEKYPFISTDWLLFGKGSMYRDLRIQNLFEENNVLDKNIETKQLHNESYKSEMEFQDSPVKARLKDLQENDRITALSVTKIVWFYENNSFEEYFPRR